MSSDNNPSEANTDNINSGLNANNIATINSQNTTNNAQNNNINSDVSKIPKEKIDDIMED